MTAEPRHFGPENLHEVIDGGAETYIRFGLVRMATADYTSSSRSGVTVTVEVYDMGSPRNAFGRMARFLSGKADPGNAGRGLPGALGERGMLGGADLVFWKDRFLVHETLLDESPAATPESLSESGRTALPALAMAVAASIESDPPPPAEVGLFPPAHRIARTESWEPEDPLGGSGPGPCYTARYARSGKSWTAFATEPMGDRAREVAARLASTSGGAGPRIFASATGGRVVGVFQEAEPWLGQRETDDLVASLVRAFGRR